MENWLPFKRRRREVGVRGREGRRSRGSPVTPRARHTANETPTPPLLVRVARGKETANNTDEARSSRHYYCGWVSPFLTTAGKRMNKRTNKQKQWMGHCKFFRADPLVFSSVFFLICIAYPRNSSGPRSRVTAKRTSV